MSEDAKAAIWIIFAILAVIIITLVIYNKEKEEEEKEEERKKKELEEEEARRVKKEEEEEAWRQSTLCCICNEKSLGLKICHNCIDRSEILKKELPLNKTKNYEVLTEFHQELIDKIIFAETKNDREFNSMRLFATSLILRDKYLVKNSLDDTYDFLEDVFEEGYSTSNELIDKYASKKAINEEEAKNEKISEIKENISDKKEELNKATYQSSNTDFRQKYPKEYRCNDGDYVRSKAEREIDDFLFKNRIWHEFEPEYICLNKKKYYPDFLLTDYKLYIEYFGGKDEEYLKHTEEKKASYAAERNMKVEYLYPEDDANLEERLKEICRKHNIPLK